MLFSRIATIWSMSDSVTMSGRPMAIQAGSKQTSDPFRNA
jgi:hypothetical protein